MIPISLFVTIELARLAQASYMALDPKMSCKIGQKIMPMRASNSNLNEDLAKVDFIFSDKTGTFTQNSMVMARWFVEGQSLDEMASPGILTKSYHNCQDTNTKQIFKFFSQALALCHGVIPAIDEHSQQLVYESQSPDETALLLGIKANNYKLLMRNKNKMVVEIDNISVDFEILDVIEFDSTRKRMTVIIRTPTDGIHLYCKGADNVMFERLSKTLNEESLLKSAEDELIQYSNIGLRTLAICYKPMTEDSYKNFKERWNAAQVDLKDREGEMEKIAATVECDFKLLGCTAIEDKLQDRVPETIEYLLKAKIRLWLLTGDKQETAINIGLSSRLITSQMKLMILSGKDRQSCETKMDEMIKSMTMDPEV
jgi:phospholipid-transporting ATPase